MSEFTDSYVDLLIKQYWEQPNARAEIELLASTYEKIRDLYADFFDEFDIDTATSDRLDIIGKIVGLPRVVPEAVTRSAFGFAENTDASGFDDKFLDIADVAPFRDKFEPARTSLELDDTTYRLFLKAKVMKNVGSAFMDSDVRVSLQDVISAAFEGRAYVIDRQDMTLRLYVSASVDLDHLTAIRNLDLLPKPQAVRYDSIIIQAAPFETFGFSGNPNALSFADKFDSAYESGRFAEKLVI